VHPYGALFGGVLGMTEVDGHGISGLEWGWNRAGDHSEPLRTTLDIQVQKAAAASLQSAMTQANAAAGAAIVMNMNGEILGMVSLPDADPASREMFLPHRASASLYEMGDLSRLFVSALQFSVPGAPQSTFVSPHGMGARLGLRNRAALPIEAGTPFINAHPLHRAFDLGKDIATTPIQVAAAIVALINGGEYHQPTLVLPDTGREPPGREVVLLPEMSAALREEIGDGMTGVAQKVINGAYSPDHLVATPVAVFPVAAPQLLVCILLDDPNPANAAAIRAVVLQTVMKTGASVERLTPQ